MPEVQCNYCGTRKEFRDMLHREESKGDFRKYYHFCDAKHLAMWQEEQKQKSQETPNQNPQDHTEIF